MNTFCYILGDVCTSVVVICPSGQKSIHREMNGNSIIVYKWTSVSWLRLCFFLSILFFVFLILACKYHISL